MTGQRTGSISDYPTRSLVALATLVFVAFGVTLYSMSVLLTDRAAGSEFSISLLSAGFGGATVIGGLMAPLIGRYADEHSVRGIMAMGSALGAIAMVLIAGVTSPILMLAIFWILLGPAGAMTLYEPAFVAVSHWVGPGDRNRAIALLTLIAGLASPVFVPLSGYLVTAFGWRTTAVVLGFTYAAAGALAVLLFPSFKPRDHRSHAVKRFPWRQFVADRRLLLISLSVVLAFSSLNSLLFHRVAVFEEHGFEVAVVATLAGISGLLTLPGRYLMPTLSQRYRHTTLYALATSATAATMVLAIIGTPAWVMVTFFLSFGLFFGFVLPTRPVIMTDWYHGEDFGSIMGKQWSVAAVVGGLAPLMVGVVRDATGSYVLPIAGLIGATSVAVVATVLAGRSEAGRMAAIVSSE